MPKLAGERVVLRPARPDDASRLLEILTAPGTAEWWPDFDEEDAREHTSPRDDAQSFMIEVDGEVVGFIQSWEETDPQYRHAGIDVSLDPGWHERGLGTDAMRTLARHLFDDLGHHRITIDPAAHNLRAIRCYEKVGFRPVGIMRRYKRGGDGSWHDGLLMDLLPEDLR